MSTAELKLNIINRIAQLKDKHLIIQIQSMLDAKINEDIYELSKEEKQRIAEAKEEYSQGRVISNNRANAKIKKWLKEK